MADNCPHVPVDMLHGWHFRSFGFGQRWDIGGEAVVDHDERPEWDRRERSGGDCEMWETPGIGWAMTVVAPVDRTGWPPDESEWESDRCYLGRVEWSPCGRRWMMYDPEEGGYPVDWTSEPIDLTVWRPLG